MTCQSIEGKPDTISKERVNNMGHMQYLKSIIDTCITAITKTTGITCYSDKQDQAQPYRYVEIAKVTCEPTKTFDIAVVTIHIHTIFPQITTAQYDDNIYEWLDNSEQAMNNVSFPNLTCINANHLGLISNNTEDTQARHAIQAYAYTICETT